MECGKIMNEITKQVGNLDLIENWQSVANGVWKSEIGDMNSEKRYISLAAEAPRLDRINGLSPTSFPLENCMPSFQDKDGKITVRIPTEKDEHIYGFGLQFDGLKKNKTVLTLNTDHWGKGNGRTHAPVPFYISSRGYGVFFNTARFMKVYCQIGNRKDSQNNPLPVDRNPVSGSEPINPWQAVPQGDAVEAHIIGKGMELVIFGGTSMLDVIQRYNLYCGGGTLPPLWGLGFWHRVHATFDADQTEAELSEFNKKQFPLDVIGLEPGWMSSSYPCTFEWQTARFSDPFSFVERLRKQGVRLNLWINPYISPESGIYEKIYPYSGSHLVWLGLVPDYYMSQARQLLVQQHTKEHLKIGISGYKVDEVDSYNHKEYITGISSASLCGILWTPEIRNASSAREWLNRMQTVCFSSMAKLNAWATGLQPWSFSEVEDAVRQVIQLRMRLLPYIYSSFANYYFNGVPPIRAMILEDDGNTEIETRIDSQLDSEANPYAMDKIIEKTDQFMFGPSIMVAPFYENQATEHFSFMKMMEKVLITKKGFTVFARSLSQIRD